MNPYDNGPGFGPWNAGCVNLWPLAILLAIGLAGSYYHWWWLYGGRCETCRRLGFPAWRCGHGWYGFLRGRRP